MIQILSLILLGFSLGMRHATDPDHVIAVSTIVSRQPTVRSALLIGGLWGVGHTVTIVLVGAAIVLFTVVIPPRLGLSMEMVVALMLIVLGMWNLTGFVEQLRGSRSGDGCGVGPFHSHWHHHAGLVRNSRLGPDQQLNDDERVSLGQDDRWFARLGVYQILRPLIVGLVHGLAGSAAVALLVLALIKNVWGAMAYLVLFGIGTIAGMMLITAALGSVFAYASTRSTSVERYLRVASGLLSLGFGLFLAYQIAVVDGLMTGEPDATMLR